MGTSGLGKWWDRLESEELKHVMEFGLHTLALQPAGAKLLELTSGGRIRDKRLQVGLAGLEFENPLVVGAGWDKKGAAIDGLYALGFGGTEVGTVLVHPQVGNPQPRMWYKDGAGLNRLGFNSPGMERVAANLEHQRRPGIVGINVGKNKLTPDDQAPWAHAAVIERLWEFADYFVINVASPNTPGLRNLLKPEPLGQIIKAAQTVLKKKGAKPLFVKTTVDLALEDLDKVIEVCLEYKVTGIVDTNTTIDDELKSAYGWKGEAGGLSGDNAEFRRRATERMKHITRTTKGTGLQRIGVGAIHDGPSAIERLEAGAQIVQVVTGIRQHKSWVAHMINAGILQHLERTGAKSVEEIIGTAV